MSDHARDRVVVRKGYIVDAFTSFVCAGQGRNLASLSSRNMVGGYVILLLWVIYLSGASQASFWASHKEVTRLKPTLIKNGNTRHSTKKKKKKKTFQISKSTRWVMHSRNLMVPVIKTKWAGTSFHALRILGKKEGCLMRVLSRICALCLRTV